MTSFACDTPGPIDLATQAAMPLLAAPVDGDFVPLMEPGRRLLLARDGLYVEARSEALYVRLQIGVPTFTPYGELDESIELVNGPLLRKEFENLMQQAMHAHPCEMAALVVAAPDRGYTVLHLGTGTRSRISYDDSGHDECLLVIDAHSHGNYPAAFSSTDDASDRSRIGPHISMVFGNCGALDTMDVSTRVCVGHYLIPIGQHKFGQVIA